MIRETKDGVTLAVRAQPGAKKTAIVGIYGEGASAQLKIAVQAPPVEGRANEALIMFLAERFSLPKSAVGIVSRRVCRGARCFCCAESSYRRRSRRWKRR